MKLSDFRAQLNGAETPVENMEVVIVSEEGDLFEVTEVKFSHIEGGQIHIHAMLMD